MKKSSLRDSLPLGFVEQQLSQRPLESIDDFTQRIKKHVVQQLEEIKQAALREQLPVIRPLAKSIQMGMHVLNDHTADDLLQRIQSLCAKMQDVKEIENCIDALHQQTQHILNPSE